MRDTTMNAKPTAERDNSRLEAAIGSQNLRLVGRTGPTLPVDPELADEGLPGMLNRWPLYATLETLASYCQDRSDLCGNRGAGKKLKVQWHDAAEKIKALSAEIEI